MMHLDTRGGGDDDGQVSGGYWYHIERIKQVNWGGREGRLIIAPGVDQDFWKLGEERESLRGNKHDTPCIVYQLGAILCWRHNLQDSGNLSTNYPMFSITAMESVHVES